MNVGLFGVKHHETLLPIQQQSASIAGFICVTLSLQLIKAGDFTCLLKNANLAKIQAHLHQLLAMSTEIL